eukprot:TRINITY_DN9232_c0_g1_i2.p1 TRINITY_DN9232_c0_g1~~TRINITY_DN9232_c0_g1_i2.p1  ORF type:complete len:1264 (+),score=367.22 TRINITY_DN9232_c0_g1_i2:239-4030(+)
MVLACERHREFSVLRFAIHRVFENLRVEFSRDGIAEGGIVTFSYPRNGFYHPFLVRRNMHEIPDVQKCKDRFTFLNSDSPRIDSTDDASCSFAMRHCLGIPMTQIPHFDESIGISHRDVRPRGQTLLVDEDSRDRKRLKRASSFSSDHEKRKEDASSSDTIKLIYYAIEPQISQETNEIDANVLDDVLRVSMFGGPMREEKTIATMGIASLQPLHLPSLTVTVRLPQLKTPASITFAATKSEEIVELSLSEAENLRLFHNMLLFGTVEVPPESSRRRHLFLRDVESSPFFLIPLFEDDTNKDFPTKENKKFVFDEGLVGEMVQSPICVLDMMKEIMGVSKQIDFDWENDAMDSNRTHIESMIVGSPIHIATKNMQPGLDQFVIEKINWNSPLHSVNTKEGRLVEVCTRKFGISSTKIDMLQPLISLKPDLNDEETSSSRFRASIQDTPPQFLFFSSFPSSLTQQRRFWSPIFESYASLYNSLNKAKTFEAMFGLAISSSVLLNMFCSESFAHALGDPFLSYDRLEFLGDAALDLILVDRIGRSALHWDRERIIRLRRFLSENASLRRVVIALSLDQLVMMGNSDISMEAKVYADVFEAIVGGILCEHGMDSCDRFVENSLLRVIELPEDDDITRSQLLAPPNEWKFNPAGIQPIKSRKDGKDEETKFLSFVKDELAVDDIDLVHIAIFGQFVDHLNPSNLKSLDSKSRLDPSIRNSFDRLRLLGETLFKFVSACYLYQKFPKSTSNEYTLSFGEFQKNGTFLAQWAHAWRIDSFLDSIGVFEQSTTTIGRHTSLCGIVEALLGVAFVDGGGIHDGVLNPIFSVSRPESDDTGGMGVHENAIWKQLRKHVFELEEKINPENIGQPPKTRLDRFVRRYFFGGECRMEYSFCSPPPSKTPAEMSHDASRWIGAFLVAEFGQDFHNFDLPNVQIDDIRKEEGKEKEEKGEPLESRCILGWLRKIASSKNVNYEWNTMKKLIHGGRETITQNVGSEGMQDLVSLEDRQVGRNGVPEEGSIVGRKKVVHHILVGVGGDARKRDAEDTAASSGYELMRRIHAEFEMEDGVISREEDSILEFLGKKSSSVDRMTQEKKKKTRGDKIKWDQDDIEAGQSAIKHALEVMRSFHRSDHHQHRESEIADDVLNIRLPPASRERRAFIHFILKRKLPGVSTKSFGGGASRYVTLFVPRAIIADLLKQVKDAGSLDDDEIVRCRDEDDKAGKIRDEEEKEVERVDPKVYQEIKSEVHRRRKGRLWKFFMERLGFGCE